MCAKDITYLSHRKWKSLASTMEEEKLSVSPPMNPVSYKKGLPCKIWCNNGLNVTGINNHLLTEVSHQKMEPFLRLSTWLRTYARIAHGLNGRLLL